MLCDICSIAATSTDVRINRTEALVAASTNVCVNYTRTLLVRLYGVWLKHVFLVMAVIADATASALCGSVMSLSEIHGASTSYQREVRQGFINVYFTTPSISKWYVSNIYSHIYYSFSHVFRNQTYFRIQCQHSATLLHTTVVVENT